MPIDPPPASCPLPPPSDVPPATIPMSIRIVNPVAAFRDGVRALWSQYTGRAGKPGAGSEAN